MMKRGSDKQLHDFFWNDVNKKNNNNNGGAH